jgi:hypothetical protein
VVQATCTLVGVKVQVVLMGSPVQERVTYALKPLTGVTVTLLLTKPPTAVDNEVGVAATVKPAAVDAFACTTSGLEIEVREVVWLV